MASRLKRLVLPFLAIGGIFAGGIVVEKFRATDPTPPNEPQIAVRAISISRPAPRDSSYVGSRACAECHQQIFDRFTQSPMGQSMATIADAVEVENYDDVRVEPSKQRHYRVSRDGDVATHQEILLDQNGTEYADQSETIRYVVGSGRRGRGYLSDRDGLLFQSPLGWYTHGQRWDLSPGYLPERHPRFSRRIGDGCLYCHAGRMHNQGLATDRYEEPVFEELAIGCERCHGPGERHVTFHSDGATKPADDPIVNPVKLEISKRESVCNQCHLLGRSVIPRYGRRYFDFRPGDNLDEVFSVLSQEIDVELHGSLQAVNQVEQMRSSKCYEASGGELGCISCHDAHSTPTVEQREEHYRLRCLTCHEDQGCSLDLATRQQAPANDSCIHCHMPALPASDVPHTSFTDHRIPRDSQATPTKDQGTGNSENGLTFFDNTDAGLSRFEIERTRGIAVMTNAWRKRDDHLAAKALSHLLEAIDGDIHNRLATIDDLPLLDEFAAGYMLLDDTDTAETCWNRLLELNANSESALMGLARIAEERQDLKALGEHLSKLVELNPTSEDAFALLLKQRHYSNDAVGAIQAAERVLEINPTNTKVRAWLAARYQQQGKTEEAQRQQEFLNNIGAGPSSSSAN